MIALRRISNAEVTPAISAFAKRIRDEIRPKNYQLKDEFPFESAGQQYVAKIELHYHDPNGPIRPHGHHKGVTIFAVQEQEERPKMQSIKQGSKGPDVGRWQAFLRGLGFDIAVDGDFGQKTHNATVKFQTNEGLKPDGVVGNRTYAAAMREGFALVDDEPFPPAPTFASLGAAGRNKLFGKFPFVPAPTDTNPEAIRITDDWARENIVTVEIPQLRGFSGAPMSCKVQAHRLVAPKLVELFEAWENADLLKHLITWGGSYVPRFVRGSKTTLSSHAHGSAFDVNVAWNGLGKVPAAVGERGCVRELVAIANRLGWYWGGHFSRPDGQHFELVEIDAHADTVPAPAMPEDPN